MKNNPVTAAVIVAAGSGRRMGGVSKPLIPLGGITVFARVLAAFAESASVSSVVVVCGDRKPLEELAKDFPKKLVFVDGGKTRSESVRRGAEAADGEFICIHDCARPFITAENIDAVVGAAWKCGAACACGPVYDTVKYVDTEKKLVYTPDRDKLIAIQTPQVFKKEIYLVSSLKAKADGFVSTDDTALAEHAGFTVEYVNIGSRNMKLTDSEDVKRAKAMLFLESRDQ